MLNVRERTREPKKASWRLLIFFFLQCLRSVAVGEMRRYSCAADAVGEAWRCGVATSKLLGGQVLLIFATVFTSLSACRHLRSVYC